MWIKVMATFLVVDVITFRLGYGPTVTWYGIFQSKRQNNNWQINNNNLQTKK